MLLQMARILIVACVLATSALLACSQDIVLLGDALSDNGSGYAGFVKLVLQTNDVSKS